LETGILANQNHLAVTMPRKRLKNSPASPAVDKLRKPVAIIRRKSEGLVVLRPKAIQKIGSELAIAWSNGEETYVSLEKLRRACPCAACGGEPDVLGRAVRPEVHFQPTSFDLEGWEIVGGYGWQPRWGDGHRTGIYSFSYLQRLGAEG
jgi:DUF971 family protein